MSLITNVFISNYLKPIFHAQNLIFPYAIHPFDISTKYPNMWKNIKILYITFSVFSISVLINFIINLFLKNPKENIKINNKKTNEIDKTKPYLLIGKNLNGENIYLPEKGLYQNILITGTIGSGKTSSAMYPFLKQLLKYKNYNDYSKIGMLILDVKGNFYNQVKIFAEDLGRTDDVIVIDLSGEIKYNPLDKPNLKPHILANRLKNILLLFSENNSESYWLDKAEQILCEAIKLCRLSNSGYVTFSELHKLITVPEYYQQKIDILRELFLNKKLNTSSIYDLLSAIEFFEKEYWALDTRTLSILKSEITRITGTFISDYDILNTFCPDKAEINFNGFEDVIEQGKIVVLNMNIAEYRNLSKIIAAYLKLDFQSEVLSRLSKEKSNSILPVAFISDEFHEYVTANDADFFAQSREAKCINIIATQSYTSILNTLKNESTTKVIFQNLINKLWLRTDDIFTIEEAQKQIGKEYKKKTSKTISENARETNFNYITNTLFSRDSNISESINTYTEHDFIYDSNFFTRSLETFSCLAFLSDGFKIIPPQKINLIPYFLDERIDLK